jgi:hypothetical protein
MRNALLVLTAIIMLMCFCYNFALMQNAANELVEAVYVLNCVLSILGVCLVNIEVSKSVW